MDEPKVCGRCNKPKEGDNPCKCGRPTKLTPEFLAAAEAVLAQGDDVIILTDEELLSTINDRLPEAEQVGTSTFEAWKAAVKDEVADDNWRKFQGLLKKALIREKKSLYSNLRGDEKAWQRWAWIIERKFDEWNIKRKVEQDVTVKKDGAAALASTLLDE